MATYKELKIQAEVARHTEIATVITETKPG